MGFDMTSWIVSVCGIALLSVLVDVILPDGKMQKYVQVVVGVVLTFALLSPISRLFSKKYSSTISVDNYFYENIPLQQEFLDGIEVQTNLARVQKVEQVISSLAIPNTTITMQFNGYILVEVQCNKQTLQVLQSALSVVESKIMILWSENNGSN